MNKELNRKLSEINIDRIRLERVNDIRGKKLEKLESETREMKYIQNIDVPKLLDNFKRQEAENNVLKRKEQNFEGLMKTVEKNNEMRLKAAEKTLGEEIGIKNKAFQKLELMKEELHGFRLTQQDPTIVWIEK